MKKEPVKPTDIEKKLARLDAFINLNPRPVIEIDVKGNVLDLNSSALAFFPDLKKKGAKHPYLSNLKEVLAFLTKEKKPFRRYIKIKKKLWKQLFYYVPEFESIHIYGSDDTERTQAQENLKESEKRYHMLFEKMNYGYALQDIIFDKNKKPVDYRFIDVNQAFEKLSHVKKDFIVGKTINEISKRPETSESIKQRKHYDKVASGATPMYLESYNPELKKYFELYAYKPNKTQMALIFSDITNRKKTDEEKNNFISIMSHELRNPLTPIMANAQFISSILKAEKIKNPAIKDSIEVIEKQATMMADLLNDILDVSKLSRHKIQLKKTKLNICDLVKNSVATSMPFINTKHQDLSVYFSQDPIYMQADPVRMEQIMVNIINNASKYTQPEGQIVIHAGIKNGTLEISVKDNGEGMSPEKIARIFDLFNDDSQPFMGIGGLGIGLNIVKNLVSLHGGTITVISKGENKGSEFILRFPTGKNTSFIKKSGVVKIKKEATTTNHKKQLKILVVDDNKDIQNAISKILQMEGYRVKTADDGLTAVRIAHFFEPEIGLVDIGLPDIKGYEVARQIKEQYRKKNKKIKLIAFTGYGQQNDKKLAKDAGFDHHVTKPVDVNYLLKLI